jgi:RNA polymerase sigma factor (sigma-70 family)
MLFLWQFNYFYPLPHLNISWTHITAGDQNAYSEAYLHFYERFYNYGLKFTKEITIVEDAIQEVLLSMWMDRSKIAMLQNPAGYFFTSFRNNLILKIKNQSKQLPLEMAEWEPDFARETILVNQEFDSEIQQKLQSVLDTLTSRQREAIFLRFYEGLPYEDVAQALGISVKATYKIVARGLLQLREKMSLPMFLLLFMLHSSD